MKLKPNPYICSNCYEKIALLGWPCAFIMDFVSVHYIHQTPFIFSQSESNDPSFKLPLEYMEKKGYVISTESDDNSIQIIPNMSKCLHDATSKTLCWCIKD